MALIIVGSLASLAAVLVEASHFLDLWINYQESEWSSTLVSYIQGVEWTRKVTASYAFLGLMSVSVVYGLLCLTELEYENRVQPHAKDVE